MDPIKTYVEKDLLLVTILILSSARLSCRASPLFTGSFPLFSHKNHVFHGRPYEDASKSLQSLLLQLNVTLALINRIPGDDNRPHEKVMEVNMRNYKCHEPLPKKFTWRQKHGKLHRRGLMKYVHALESLSKNPCSYRREENRYIKDSVEYLEKLIRELEETYHLPKMSTKRFKNRCFTSGETCSDFENTLPIFKEAIQSFLNGMRRQLQREFKRYRKAAKKMRIKLRYS